MQKRQLKARDPLAIDLHMHSRISDGTDTPQELLSRVREKGLWLFSVTDHDAIRAADILPPLLVPGDPCFLPGVEFSCRDEEGKYHVLGYGYDPAAEAIRRVVEHGHSLRMDKLKTRLTLLRRRFGITFPPEEIDALLALDNPGKPHIGNLMVKYGYAESKDEAIRQYINPVSTGEAYVRPEEAIRGILGAGGIPVLAHPCYGSGDEMILGDDMQRRLRRLMDFGLQGMEALYSTYTPKLRGEMLRLAEAHDLYVTAGSDYHGANKLVRLGDIGAETLGAPPRGLIRFLEDALSVAL